ncbi:MAG: protein-disulfide reductase DsbD family protein [Bdellovibrionales bacterium]
MMNSLLRFLTFCLLLSLSYSHASAAVGSWQHDNDLSLRLISATKATGNSQEIILGLEIDLKEGVHTYWRSPGFAGAPPHLDWAKSENFESAEILYPAPVRFGPAPFDSIGYEGHIVLPLKIALHKTGQAFKAQAHLDLLICKELCLPKQFDLEISLPSGTTGKSAEAPLIEAALARVPKAPTESTIHIDSATLDKTILSLSLRADQPFKTPDIFIETQKDIDFQAPVFTINANANEAKLRIPFTSENAFTLADLTVTITDGQNALTQNLGSIEETRTPPLPFWCILALALLGGFILNLMPCVLPVLSLKIFSLIRYKRKSRAVIRRAFLSTAAGILFSFFVLATTMIALKASGHAVGWGIHFQQPLFLVFMIVVLTFFAANLWGFYELGMPRLIQKLIDPEKHPRLSGDFANGALATMLATPCSAPFLGTAISFALAAGWVEILSVFMALGVGMALPYLLIAAQPRIAWLFPAPGAWMQTLSRILGFGLAGTALWLLNILHAQLGGMGSLIIAGTMGAMLFMIILRHRGASPFITYPGFTAILITVFSLALLASTPLHLTRNNGLWHAFEEAAIERSVLEGKTVFVDVGADWCLTCKMNKRFALADERVTKRLFHDTNVIAMQGDWTNPDPVITDFLRKYERFGVPFNIVFNKMNPAGLVLPEILTPDIVLKALGPDNVCKDGESC